MAVDAVMEHRTIVMPRGRTTSACIPLHPEVRVGGRIGHYRLCLEIATGGMSTVYLARAVDGVGIRGFVAIKCLKPQLAGDPEFVAMFDDEVRIASRIRHPNVCQVLDYGEHAGVRYLAMELLAGRTVAAVRRELANQLDAWPRAQHAGLVARMIADAAEGLHAAHELTDAREQPLQIVHRDVSPENLFLGFDGNVKVMDFGVASARLQHHQTQPGALKGKYCYLAPEALHGRPVDRRADVWGLGVVAWELLTGRRLFERDNDVKTLRAITEMKLQAPSAARPGIPQALDAVVMRALERDPNRRYPTARELARALTCFLADERLAIGLADLSELADKLFPSGRACERQMLDTVERLDVAEQRSDDQPTVLLVDGTPVPIEFTEALAGAPPATSTGPGSAAPPPAKHGRRWAWALGPPLAAIAIVLAGLLVMARRDAAGVPPTEAPRPVERVVERATPPPLDGYLEPVQLETGEVVFRLKPREPAATCE